MNYAQESLKLHEKLKGKLEIHSRIATDTNESLALAYTPGVAQPCIAIQKNPLRSFDLTRRWNTVAVISDGSAVLGLGNVGPEASMPVMEGKSILFKNFGDVDAIPLCINTQDPDQFVNTVKLLSGSFGGINLEDISSPRCFEIEKKLQECVDIPVFHDDQHGTAIVVAAALINALKLTGKKIEEIKIVQNGPGAAGTAIVKMLIHLGAQNILTLDEFGILTPFRDHQTAAKEELALLTNSKGITGSLKEAIKNADVFIGTSIGNILSEEMIKSMNNNPIVFACANPVPEIEPESALKAGAAVVCTGRSDYPNQVNNVLVFPGLFRGALDAGAVKITENMKIAAAYALANMIEEKDLSSKNILPKPFDLKVKDQIANAVKQAAVLDNVTR